MCPHSPWSSFWKTPSLLLQLHFLEKHKQGSICGNHQPFVPPVVFLCSTEAEPWPVTLKAFGYIFKWVRTSTAAHLPPLREILGGSVECADVYVVISVTLAALPWTLTTWHKHGRRGVSGSWAHSVMVEEAGRAAGRSHPQKHVEADVPITEDQEAERER